MNATQTPPTLGRYVLHDSIASGGMATVYFGQLRGQGGFARIVAVKRMHPHLALEKEFVAMLLDEAYLAGRIRHPNVVSTLDVVSEAGELLIVMDYVHGETLSRLVRSCVEDHTPIPIDIVAAIMIGVLNGLHAAHETTNEQGEPLRIVHRDVSPQNVVVGVDGVPRLLDFGVAKAQDQIHSTKEGVIRGKVAYMALEQLTNDVVDRRADIYGAGVMLWELLTGMRLSPGERSLAQLVKNTKHPRPSVAMPGVTGALDHVTERALAMHASDRYETARQMAIAIEQAVHVASPSAVGEWVATVAEARLEELSRMIRAIDARSGPRGASAPLAATGQDADSSSFAASSMRTRGPYVSEYTTVAAGSNSKARSPRRLYTLVLSVLGLVVLVFAAFAVYPRTTKPPSDTASIPLASVDVVASAIVSSSPPAASVSMASSPPDTPPAHSSTQPTRSTAHSSGRRAALPQTHPPTAPDCNPPYTVDANGVRHYKTACPLE
jgi:serine/threonine-protein kinase